MRERRERAKRRLLALVDAEIGLQPPDRDDDRTRHAELLLDPLQQPAVLDHHVARLGQAAVDSRRSELLEALLERLLAAVERQHLRIGRKPGERGRGLLGDALRHRVLLEGRDEGIEIAATLRGRCGSLGAGDATADQHSDKPSVLKDHELPRLVQPAADDRHCRRLTEPVQTPQSCKSCRLAERI